jgi:UDP-N-acetylglucosamine 3-dehydrogenase
MIRASVDTGRQLRTAFPVRYLPAIRQAGEIVRSGGLGRILAVNGTNHGRMDHTVHVADALRWMLDAEARSVYAEIGTFFGAGGIDDGAILTLELEGGFIADGAFATIDPSWSRGEGYPTWGDVTLRITGSSGVLEVDAFVRRLTTFDHEARNISWTHTGEDMNVLMLDDFLRGVAEGSPAGASGVDGLRALEIVLAAYRSAEDNEPRGVERTQAPGA